MTIDWTVRESATRPFPYSSITFHSSAIRRGDLGTNLRRRASSPILIEAMPSVALRAHYDGTHVVLDEPYNLAPNARLLVTVLDFLANPAEDIYSGSDGEPFGDDASSVRLRLDTK